MGGKGESVDMELVEKEVGRVEFTVISRCALATWVTGTIPRFEIVFPAVNIFLQKNVNYLKNNVIQGTFLF